MIPRSKLLRRVKLRRSIKQALLSIKRFRPDDVLSIAFTILSFALMLVSIPAGGISYLITSIAILAVNEDDELEKGVTNK